MSPRTHRQWTKVRMVFHQHPAYPLFHGPGELRSSQTHRGTPKVISTKVGASPDVLSCTITKEITQTCGGFTATLVPRQEYLLGINPNDWVEIFIDTGETATKPIMVASVDRVARRRTTNQQGGTAEVISISGRDYGKALLSTQLIMDPLLGATIDQTTFTQDVLISAFNERVMEGAEGTPLRRPDKVLAALLERYHDSRVQCVLPPSLLSNIATYGGSDAAKAGGLRRRLHEVRGRIMLVAEPNLAGNLWNTMEQYTNPLLNELWVDTINGVPTLTLEERPYSSSSFGHLAGFNVEETEVVQEDIGKSGSDLRNWFRVFTDDQYLPTELITAAGTGYGASYSIQRGGLQKMEGTTNAFGEFDRALVTADEKVQTSLLGEWAGILAEWNAQNDELLAGTMTTRLRPDILVGSRLDYTNTRTNERLSFYIESISHAFNYPGTGTTSLSLTRGVERDRQGNFPRLRPLVELLRFDELQLLQKFKFLQVAQRSREGVLS